MSFVFASIRVEAHRRLPRRAADPEAADLPALLLTESLEYHSALAAWRVRLGAPLCSALRHDLENLLEREAEREVDCEAEREAERETPRETPHETPRENTARERRSRTPHETPRS